MRAIGQHSSKTPEWGTTPRIAQLARIVMGRVDVDPASSDHWNRVIQAARIITKQQDGRRTPWVPGAPAPNKLIAHRRKGKPVPFTALVNPPGERTGELVAFYWRALAAYFELGFITSAVYVGFSVEQLSRLQRVNAPSHPLEHGTLVPSRRLHYRARRGRASQPGHASFVTLLTTSRAEMKRFVDLGAEFGHVTRGARWR